MDNFFVHGKPVFGVLGDPAWPLQEEIWSAFGLCKKKFGMLAPRFSALSVKIWSAQTWLQWLQ